MAQFSLCVYKCCLVKNKNKQFSNTRVNGYYWSYTHLSNYMSDPHLAFSVANFTVHTFDCTCIPCIRQSDINLANGLFSVPYSHNLNYTSLLWQWVGIIWAFHAWYYNQYIGYKLHFM